MVAPAIEKDVRETADLSPIDHLESLVPAAVRLAQLHAKQAVSDQEFEAGLANLFRSARMVQASLGTDYHRVHFDWADSPVGVDAEDVWREAVYARIDQLLQPYFAHAWEYSGGAIEPAVHFDEQEPVDSDTGCGRIIKGVWIDLVR
jgi:hypothetical protein